jgi:bifunctional DNA-binding transcriptional regulator/antitoxin component of YhaV-PrlF toxin-antitoxin module
MKTLTVSAKGQLTLEKGLLEHLGVHPGDKVVVDKLANGRIELRSARPVSDAFGSLKAKRRGRSLSIEDINRIAAQGWSGKRQEQGELTYRFKLSPRAAYPFTSSITAAAKASGSSCGRLWPAFGIT